MSGAGRTFGGPGRSGRSSSPTASSWGRCTSASRESTTTAARWPRSTSSGFGAARRSIVTGGSAVSRVGAGGRNYSFVNDDADAPKLERIAAAVHEAGGRVLLQLFHAGRYAYRELVRTAAGGAVGRVLGLQPVRAAGAERRRSAGGDRRVRAWGRPGGRARVRRRGADGLGGLPAQPVHGPGDQPPRGRLGWRPRAPPALSARRGRGGAGGLRPGQGGGLPDLRRGPGRRGRAAARGDRPGPGARRRCAERRHRLARGPRPDRPGARPPWRVDAVGTRACGRRWRCR